jgi:hypothetical protein
LVEAYVAKRFGSASPKNDELTEPSR